MYCASVQLLLVSLTSQRVPPTSTQTESDCTYVLGLHSVGPQIYVRTAASLSAQRSDR